MSTIVITIEEKITDTRPRGSEWVATILQPVDHFTHGLTGESGDGPIGAVEDLIENIATAEVRQAHINMLDSGDD